MTSVSHDMRVAAIRRVLAWLKRHPDVNVRGAAHRIDMDFEELVTMADEQIAEAWAREQLGHVADWDYVGVPADDLYDGDDESDYDND